MVDLRVSVRAALTQIATAAAIGVPDCPPAPDFSCDVQLYKGHASIIARSSPMSLYNKHIASMDIGGGWQPEDSTGFIRINSVRLRAHSARERSLKK
jgi:hypothetical protein